jgi:hypothetical protein
LCEETTNAPWTNIDIADAYKQSDVAKEEDNKRNNDEGRGSNYYKVLYKSELDESLVNTDESCKQDG